jgi:hypothetical protein
MAGARIAWCMGPKVIKALSGAVRRNWTVVTFRGITSFTSGTLTTLSLASEAKGKALGHGVELGTAEAISCVAALSLGVSAPVMRPPFLQERCSHRPAFPPSGINLQPASALLFACMQPCILTDVRPFPFLRVPLPEG